MYFSKSYDDLLKSYTEQVVKLEKIKLEHRQISWSPFGVLDSRIFIYDEYLTNDLHRGFCYEEKNLIMPYLVQFMAEYEQSSEEEKAKLEEIKPKSQYQESLDNLSTASLPFIDFKKMKLKELTNLKYSFTIPFPPKRRNATRQIAQYQEDRKKYFEQLDILERCKKEWMIELSFSII